MLLLKFLGFFFESSKLLESKVSRNLLYFWWMSRTIYLQKKIAWKVYKLEKKHFQVASGLGFEKSFLIFMGNEYGKRQSFNLGKFKKLNLKTSKKKLFQIMFSGFKRKITKIQSVSRFYSFATKSWYRFLFFCRIFFLKEIIENCFRSTGRQIVLFDCLEPCQSYCYFTLINSL